MYRVGVVTASDRSFSGLREDESGALASQILTNNGYEVVRHLVVPDEEEMIAEALIQLSDVEGLQLILTTGGTGFALRDVTPEATLSVVEREVPGIPEAIRWHSLAKTPRAMLSRARAGIRGRTLIVNLPGSPKAVKESLEFILETLDHGLAVLNSEMSTCGQSYLQEAHSSRS